MPGEKELQDSTISSTSDSPEAAASESRDCNNNVLQSNRVTSTTTSSTSDSPEAAASESRDCNNKVLQSSRVTSTNTCRMSQRLKQALRKRFSWNLLYNHNGPFQGHQMNTHWEFMFLLKGKFASVKIGILFQIVYISYYFMFSDW